MTKTIFAGLALAALMSVGATAQTSAPMADTKATVAAAPAKVVDTAKPNMGKVSTMGKMDKLGKADTKVKAKADTKMASTKGKDAPRTEKSLACSKDADGKKLHGKARKDFMSTCKKA